MTTLMQDVRYGLRMLVKNPGFTIVAVLALALGIGANTAMFSYVNAWVLHPLPYPHSERLVVLLGDNTRTGGTSHGIHPGDFYDFQRESRDFQNLCAWTVDPFNLTGNGTPERIQGNRVSWNFFDTLGAKPVLGRTFLPEEDQPGAGHVAILSHGLWETRFGADPQIVGKKVQIDGESYVVVGVMAPEFQLPLTGEANIWVPLALSSKARAGRQGREIMAMGRLKPDLTLLAAQGELSGIASRLSRTYPDTNADSGVLLHTLEYEIGSEQGNEEVLICFWIVALVLLMACANVANLMLARATGRTKELAVRTALGATPRRLVRQLVTETVLLFLAASAVGVGVAYWTLAWIGAAIPVRTRGYLVNYGHVSLDYQTLLYTIGIAFFAGVLFGLAPAIVTSKLGVFSMLKEASGQASSARHGSRLRSAFVVGEIALAVVIVVCSGLLATGLLRLVRANPGFRPENVVAAELDLPATKYASPAQIRGFYDQLVDRLRALPQIEAAGASEGIPFGDCCGAVPVYAVGKLAPRPGEVPYAEFAAVTPDYFSAMRIALLKGRYFAAADGPSAPPVTIVDQALASYFWPGEDPIGQKLRFTAGGTDHTATVVGVVQDVKLFNSTTARHLREIYAAFQQFPSPSMGIVVRSRADRGALAGAIRDAVWATDADQPVSLVRPIQELIDEQYAGFSIVIELMGFFSALALLLGAIGIYAVMAFNVTQRTHEIGIRMALGAHPREILWLVLRNAAWLAGLGVVIGSLAAFGASRVLNSLVFGVRAAHPLTFAGGISLLVLVALMACWIPARRAVRVDPLVALRHE
jgi:putative ABC transport system permease protein